MTPGEKLAAEEAQDKARSADTMSLLEDMREGLHEWITLMDENHKEAAEDIEFIASNQWDEKVEEDRRANDRPVMTFPKLTQFLDQLVGEEMGQRPTIKVSPGDGFSSKLKVNTQADKSIPLAQTYAGLIRQIERSSNARTAYDNGFEGAAGWGFGHWRILRRYVADSFDQELIIAPIWDPFSVAWDAAAQEYTREDAMWCAIRAKVPEKEFERRHPNAVAGTLDFSAISHASEWFQDGMVLLTEYYRKVHEDQTLLLLSDGSVIREPRDKKVDIKDELAQRGLTVVRDRVHKGHRIDWYLCTGTDILEGPLEEPGDYIPVIPCWGRMLYHKGRMRYRGLIRNAKDEQRSYNYSRTALIEKQALAPKAPWVIADEQIGEYQDIWSTANSKNHAFLPYKGVRTGSGTPLPPPQRQFGSTDVSGIIEMVQLSEQGMKSSIGIYDPSLGQKSNEQSGKAILARQQQGDRITAPFMENLAKSIAYTGRVLVNKIPRVYDGERLVRVLHDDETEDTVVINSKILDNETGKEVLINDLTVGRFEVAVDIGPSFLTRRIESAQSMLEFTQAVPAAGPFMADLIAQNSDWPGADAAAKRLKRALIPPALLEGEEGGAEIPPEAQAKIDQLTAAVEQTQMQLQQAMEAAQKLSTELDTAKMEKERTALENQKLKAAGELERERAEFDRTRGEAAQADAASGKVESMLKEQAQTNAQIAEALQAQTAVLQKLVQAVGASRKAA